MAGGIVGAIVGQIAGQVVSQTLGSLLSQFGQGNVLGGLSNLITNSIGGAVKNIIGGSFLPQFIKDAASEVIDKWMASNQQATTPECQCALQEAGYADAFDAAADSVARQAGDDADKKAGGKGAANWLVALAQGLAEAQAKFIDAAMQNMDTMRANADVEKIEYNSKGQPKDPGAVERNADKRNQFLMAQSEYQANIQMFNMLANMTATSLKALGEGLTAIARKQ